MIETPVIAESRSRKTVVVVSLVLVGLGALVFTGVFAFFLFFQVRNRLVGENRTASNSAFLNVPESAVPGRYKWSHGPKEFFMVLYEDHTFMNQDGTTFSPYRWDVGPDGLSIQWLNSSSRFTKIEAPGIYLATPPDGTTVRLEKLPPYEPSQLVPPKPVATIALGSQCETNGLTPVNTEGDGEINRAKIGEAECYQLVRQENRPAGYLYLQIASELKDPPFTNALAMVEYFDGTPSDGGRRGLTVQYDAQHGVYANVQPLNLGGSDTWQEATFYLPRPLFQNRQNSGADFRVCAGSPELFVRSVKLVKNTILPETKMPATAAVK